MSERSKSLSVATIVPAPKSNPNSANSAMGTKVLLSDGSELGGVVSVELKASVESGVWSAVITVLPCQIPTVSANATFVELDISTFKDESRQHARVAP